MFLLVVFRNRTRIDCPESHFHPRRSEMRHLKAALQISLIFASAVCRSQLPSKPAEKIIFVRPDPMITTSSSMAMLSADTHGTGSSNGEHPQGSVAINSVDNP